MDSAIQLLNNWGQDKRGQSTQYCADCEAILACIIGARLALRAKCRFFPRLAHEALGYAGSGAPNENILQNHSVNIIALLIKTHFSI